MGMQIFSSLGARHTSTLRYKFDKRITKGCAELVIFVGFDDNTIPGYRFYRPLYRDYVSTVHARFLKFTRLMDINLHQQSDDSGDKIGTKTDFEYLMGTVNRDDVDGLVYDTVRDVEENYKRRGTFIVA